MKINTCKWCGTCNSDKSTCDCKERIVCTKIGKQGHTQCGWCEPHAEPRFICGCITDKKKVNNMKIDIDIDVVACKIVKKIVKDISDRVGLGDEWESCDTWMQEEIMDKWYDIIDKKFRKAMKKAEKKTKESYGW